jgi:hypothetical protein
MNLGDFGFSSGLLCKESLKSDGQPFHQYQHNEQSSFTSNHKADHEYDV